MSASVGGFPDRLKRRAREDPACSLGRDLFQAARSRSGQRCQSRRQRRLQLGAEDDEGRREAGMPGASGLVIRVGHDQTPRRTVSAPSSSAVISRR